MKIAAVVVATSVLLGAAFASQQDMPMPPKVEPAKEHQWLQQLVGEWTGEGECAMPGMPPMKGTSKERVRAIGDLWIVSEMKGQMGPMEITASLTVGYDPEKKSILGTWIDSTSNYMWKYTGKIDFAKNQLVLETEGPDMMNPASTKMARYREVLEFQDKDTRTFTSSIQGAEGTWTQMMKATSKRVAKRS